tara:strand:+ start:236 stop:376 length:141 start_codon:yes stop_codon:yes gene_type:complete
MMRSIERRASTGIAFAVLMAGLLIPPTPPVGFTTEKEKKQVKEKRG